MGDEPIMVDIDCSCGEAFVAECRDCGAVRGLLVFGHDPAKVAALLAAVDAYHAACDGDDSNEWDDASVALDKAVRDLRAARKEAGA
jgi:hypothetical protein